MFCHALVLEIDMGCRPSEPLEPSARSKLGKLASCARTSYGSHWVATVAQEQHGKKHEKTPLLDDSGKKQQSDNKKKVLHILGESAPYTGLRIQTAGILRDPVALIRRPK